MVFESAQRCFEKGRMRETGVGKDYDPARAFRWYQKAAAKGSADGLNALGRCLLIGFGCAQDEEGAVKAFLQAALSGLPEALHHLGVCLMHGIGLEPDAENAFECFKLAGRGTPGKPGIVEAAVEAGRCLHEGIGVSRDDAAARTWFEAAAAEGNEEARRELERMGDVGRFGGLNSRVLDGDAVAVLNELLRRLRAGGDSLSENPASLGGASGQALGQHTPPVVVHPVSVIGCSAEVVDDWTGQEDEGELSLAAGEMIEIVNDFGDPQGTGMWYGKDPDGGEGTFPASHVRVVHDTPPAPQRTPPPPPGPIHRAESLGAYSLSRPGSAMSDSSASSAGSRGPAQERPKCVICLAEDSEPNPVAVAMVPCGHQILCEECHRDGALRAGMTCPTCRRNIASMIRVYV